MKRALIAAAILSAAAVSTPNSAHAGSFVRDAVVACSFGAGAFGALAYAYVGPLASTGALAVPVAEVVTANALLGCGVGAVGSAASSVAGGIYDFIFK